MTRPRPLVPTPSRGTADEDTMFDTLAESRRVRVRPGTAGLLSLSTHVAVVTWAAMASAIEPSPWRRVDVVERSAGYTVLRLVRAEPRASRNIAASSTSANARRDRGTAMSRLAARARPAGLAPLLTIDLAAIAEPVLSDADTREQFFDRFGPRVEDFPSTSGRGTLQDAIAALAGLGRSGDADPSWAERPVVPLASNPRPDYPEMLREAHVEGEVRVQFLVDTSGVPDPRSVRVVTSSHELFTSAVRAVLPRLHFLPAENRAGKIAVLAEQTFSFVLR